ncbi:MAG TPA: hypothetical protein VEU30_15075 [Thermoanaerobaculia bacterium]|nr:hypothetical protein [Thermoanaerobaculia bacterium]
MPPHPDWPPSSSLIGTFDEEIPRPPQTPVTSLRDPFEGWEPTDEDVEKFKALMARWRAKE